MTVDDLRHLDLSAVCSLLGLERDSKDKKQFKSPVFRICINGFKWFDHNTGLGGGGAIDLTMHLKQITFKDASNYLQSISGELETVTARTATTTRQAETKPPAPNANNLPVILTYLVHKRGLNSDLVKWCINKGFIYADSKSNCVFRYGPSGAELRGTGKIQWRSVYGSIERGFILPAHNAAGVALLESAIDALSYRQLHRDIITVSIAGNGNHKVMNQAVGIAKAKQLPVLSGFDNDKGGDIANKILTEYTQSAGVQLIQDRPTLKDWNETLKATALLMQ